MKEDSLYFGVFLKVVYNCIWKMTHLCIKLRKLKQQTHLTPPNIHDIVESRLRISQEGAHHLGCGLFCGILLLYQKRKERRYDLLEWKPGFRL